MMYPREVYIGRVHTTCRRPHWLQNTQRCTCRPQRTCSASPRLNWKDTNHTLRCPALACTYQVGTNNTTLPAPTTLLHQHNPGCMCRRQQTCSVWESLSSLSDRSCRPRILEKTCTCPPHRHHTSRHRGPSIRCCRCRQSRQSYPTKSLRLSGMKGMSTIELLRQMQNTC